MKVTLPMFVFPSPREGPPMAHAQTCTDDGTCAPTGFLTLRAYGLCQQGTCCAGTVSDLPQVAQLQEAMPGPEAMPVKRPLFPHPKLGTAAHHSGSGSWLPTLGSCFLQLFLHHSGASLPGH